MLRLLAVVPLLFISSCGMIQRQEPQPVYSAPVAQQPAPQRVAAPQPRRAAPVAQSGSDGSNTPDAPSASPDAGEDGSDAAGPWG